MDSKLERIIGYLEGKIDCLEGSESSYSQTCLYIYKEMLDYVTKLNES